MTYKYIYIDWYIYKTMDALYILYIVSWDYGMVHFNVSMIKIYSRVAAI